MDNDGDLDLLVTNLNDRPVLLRNDLPHARTALAHGRSGRPRRTVQSGWHRRDRDVSRGANPTVKPKELLRQRFSSGSYMSAHDQRLHFGLGPADSVPELIVRWPDGRVQTLGKCPCRSGPPRRTAGEVEVGSRWLVLEAGVD